MKDVGFGPIPEDHRASWQSYHATREVAQAVADRITQEFRATGGKRGFAAAVEATAFGWTVCRAAALEL